MIKVQEFIESNLETLEIIADVSATAVAFFQITDFQNVNNNYDWLTSKTSTIISKASQLFFDEFPFLTPLR